MLSQPLSTSVIGNKTSPVVYPVPVLDQFGAVTGHAGLIATEFTYNKDEEIYGEDEPAEYVYQVISGAVRTYKLLSDGRRQIGAFHLPGDVFGLEAGMTHRLSAEGLIDTHAPLVNRRGTAPCGRSHAPSGTEERHRTRRELPAGDGPPPDGCRHDGTADVPPGY